MIDNDSIYRRYRCIRCQGHPLIAHENCWADYTDVPKEHQHEYWCECSCGVLEDQDR